LKLLLIEPANYLVLNRRIFHFLENVARTAYYDVPPLALGVIAALTPSDWEIEILQEPRDRVDYDKPVDLVGITAATHNVKRGYEIAGEFRNRGKKVVMGGIHPSVMFNEALNYCDAVCVGEVELVWKEVIHDAEKGKLKKVYQAREVFDLSNYSPPRRDLFPKRKEVFYSITTIEASRGCPYNCDFCSVSITHGKTIRYRPVENIIQEMESIKNKRIFFVDNNIISSFQKAKELFGAMIPLKKQWTAQATISIVKDQKLLELASKSGCYGLLIGIESITEEGLKKYNKSLKTLKELKEALKILKDHGIGVLAHMVFGNDFDTRDTIRETLDKLLELDVTSATLGIIVPYPGTRLAEELEKQNRILTHDWNLYDIHHLVFKPLNISIQEFLYEIQEIRKEFFRLKQILRRTISYCSFTALGFNISSRSHNRAGHSLKPVDIVK